MHDDGSVVENNGVKKGYIIPKIEEIILPDTTHFNPGMGTEGHGTSWYHLAIKYPMYQSN